MREGIWTLKIKDILLPDEIQICVFPWNCSDQAQQFGEINLSSSHQAAVRQCTQNTQQQLLLGTAKQIALSQLLFRESGNRSAFLNHLHFYWAFIKSLWCYSFWVTSALLHSPEYPSNLYTLTWIFICIVLVLHFQNRFPGRAYIWTSSHIICVEPEIPERVFCHYR